MTQTVSRAEPDRESRRTRPEQRSRRGRRPVRRFMILTHRWLSLILGLVLLAITVSGSILLYRPEIERMLTDGAYDVSGRPATVDLAQARDAVLAEHPDFDATSVWAEHGVYLVTDYETGWTVDPGTGEVLGHVGPTPSWLQFLGNLHECFLACEDYPGSIGALVAEVPGSAWLGFDGLKITWGGLVLGLMAVILLYLSLTGIWLWFPRPSRWRSSMSVRWKRGRFSRDTDLHKVGGMIAIPFLLVWAITGASYEFGFVEKGWYAATPGAHHEYPDPLSEKLPKGSGRTPDITPAAALAAAQRLHPDSHLVNFDMPAEGDRTAAYTMYFSDGYDPYGETTYPGDLGVYVDRHTGAARDFYGSSGESVSQTLYDSFNYPVHSGYIVNGWWRLIWLLFGLSPLLLAWTGVSTWLVRRKTRKVRTRSQKRGAAPPPVPQELAQELIEDPEMDPELAQATTDDPGPRP